MKTYLFLLLTLFLFIPQGFTGTSSSQDEQFLQSLQSQGGVAFRLFHLVRKNKYKNLKADGDTELSTIDFIKKVGKPPLTFRKANMMIVRPNEYSREERFNSYQHNTLYIYFDKPGTYQLTRLTVPYGSATLVAAQFYKDITITKGKIVYLGDVYYLEGKYSPAFRRFLSEQIAMNYDYSDFKTSFQLNYPRASEVIEGNNLLFSNQPVDDAVENTSKKEYNK